MEEKYKWVMVTGGVMGFKPEEIEIFEKKFAPFIHSKEDYWGCFNFRFAETLDMKWAYCYSTLWNDQNNGNFQ